MGIGYQGYLVGPDRQNKVNEFIRRITFNVEFSTDDRSYLKNVPVPDMPFVGPGMNSNSFSSKLLAIYCGCLYIRNISAAGISECGYLVDVNTESCHNK